MKLNPHRLFLQETIELSTKGEINFCGGAPRLQNNNILILYLNEYVNYTLLINIVLYRVEILICPIQCRYGATAQRFERLSIYPVQCRRGLSDEIFDRPNQWRRRGERGRSPLALPQRGRPSLPHGRKHYFSLQTEYFTKNL